MADTHFSELITALANLQASVSKDLDEIRTQKAEIQQLKNDVFNKVARGRYIRDDQRLVLSAPEIIIGNVDAEGIMYSEGGSVILRGQQVGLEGVGSSGIVKSRAATISEIAVDPGIDGVEEVVRGQSVIIQQAKHIAIQSNKADNDGFFASSPRITGPSGVRIHADERLELDASVSSELRSQEITSHLKNLGENVATYTTDSAKAMASVTSLVAQMETLLTLQDPLSIDEVTMRTTVLELDDLTEQFNSLLPSIYGALNRAISSMSNLAEVNRRLKVLQKEQIDVTAASGSFKTKNTGASVSITAERMDLTSADGDGNIRDNADAAIYVQTGRLGIQTLKEDGSLIDDSAVRITTHDVSISTANPTVKDDGTRDYELTGSVSVNSKDILFSAVDSKDNTQSQAKESSFSVRADRMAFLSFDNESNATGSFSVRAENTSLSSTDKDGNATGSFGISAKAMSMASADKDGNATGSLTVKAENTAVSASDKTGKSIGQFSLNSKDVFIKSMDTDDKGADKNLAAGGNMVMAAEKMFVGRTDSKNTSKELLISSDKTGIYGKTTAELQQGEAKAVVQLDGGNIAIAGSKAAFYGENTLNGKTAFKADVTAPKLTADNLEAKTSFKSKNISDGIAVPGAPSSAKLSAKLKEADAPKPKAVEAEKE